MLDDMSLPHDKECQDMSSPNDNDTKKAKEEAKEKFLAYAFLHGSDRERYGGLVTELENDYAKKDNRHRATLRGAYDLLVNCKQQRGARGGFNVGERPTVSFHNDSDVIDVK